MRRLAVPALVALAGVALSTAPQAAAEDLRSSNIKRLAQVPIVVQRDDPATPDNEAVYAQGSDLAFQGDLLVAGSWQGVGTFRLYPKAPYIRQLGFAVCNGAQGDVSIYKHLVFVSVDTPQVNADGSASDGNCLSVNASAAQVLQGLAWEGVRIFSIKNPRNPKLVAAVAADCGSHTHTLLPDGNKLYLYIHSYPLTGGLGPRCNYATHRRNVIAEVDLDDPAKTKIVGGLDVTPSPGCHDVTVYPDKGLAGAACLTESQVWDISDPAQPTILSRIRNPFVLHHSSGMTWDGKILVLGDEFAGAAAGAGCAPGSQDSPIGAMWFYDISDPASPALAGYYGPPRTAIPDSLEELFRHACTNHNFSVLPMRDGSYIATTSYYAAGLSVVDFSDPANPKEIAYYVPDNEGQQPDMWAAYWYNGRIYTNDVNLPRASGSLPGTPSAGIGIYEVEKLGRAQVRYFFPRLNPQTQIARELR